MVVMRLTREKAAQAGPRDPRFDALWVAPLAGGRDGLLAHVAGEHLQPDGPAGGLDVLDEKHRDTVRFLAGRAAGHPDTDRPARIRLAYERPDHVSFERCPRRWLAKEVGDPDQEIPDQRSHLLDIVAQECEKVGEVVEVPEFHAAVDSAHQRALLVGFEVEPRAGANQGEQPTQACCVVCFSTG